MLRSRLLLNRRQLQKIGATCVGMSFVIDTFQEDHTSISQAFLHRLTAPALTYPQTTSCHGAFAPSIGISLTRQPTVEMLNKTASHEKTVDSAYEIMWKTPIGAGNFGNVYQGVHRKSGAQVAVKKISKRFTNDSTFQREMDVLMLLEQTGGHPSICLMQEHYNQGDDYYLVFDLVEGGELFDQLCQYGAYSEADAARSVRQIASALAFLKGVGIVHSDLKPENLMLSSKSKEDSRIKIVDFGCAHITNNKKKAADHEHRGTGLTPAYCPPEVLIQLQTNNNDHADIEPSFDMWSLGVIMYIMLTGAHPFDLEGGVSSEEMEKRIVSEEYILPIRDHKETKHLSEDVLVLLEGLMTRDPKTRMTAEELLENDWVRGKVASSTLISGSDSRLAEYRRHQTKIASSIFKRLMNQAYKEGGTDGAKRTGILEMAFRDLDPNKRGYISTKELVGLTSFFAPDAKLSLSEVQQLLSENMVSKYFQKNDLMYKEGEKGDTMYFVHSGSVAVTSKDGFRVVRKAGEFFGEEVLVRDTRNRAHTVECLTPVHAIEINREYFEKHLKTDEDVELTMVESDRLHQRERAKIIFGLQKGLRPVVYKKDDIIFEEQHKGNELYIMDEGSVDISVKGRKVRSLRQGEMTGEHAAFYKHKPYNVTAKCRSETCTMQVLDGHQIRKLCKKNPALASSFRDIILRRDFKKAIVSASGQDFPTNEEDLRKVFELVNKNSGSQVDFAVLRQFVSQWDPQYTDDDIRDMLSSLSLSNSGELSWQEFKRIFTLFNTA